MDFEGCNFIVPKNCLRSGAPILYGGCSPKGFHEAKTCKGTVEAASAASAAETAVPNFIVGICADMIRNQYVMICCDLMGFDGV